MRLFVGVGSLLLMLSVGAAPRPDWTKYVIFPNGGEYEVESRSPEAFVVRAKRTDDKVVKTGALAIANIKREMWTHNRLTMKVRSLNGRRVGVGVTVSHPGESGKTVMSSAPGLEIAGQAWRQVVFGLDTDFGLGDRNILISQVKIGAWIGAWKAGEEGGIEVKDLRLCGPSEVSVSSAWRPGDTFVSVPSRPKAAKVVAADALKVYFAFDNEDVVDSVNRRKKFPDAQQYGGFRETLLEHLDGRATWTTDLAAADVIVYSRCLPDPEEAKAISAAVRERGLPLYAASEVADPEVEALLPCTIGHEPPEDLPPRHRVTAVGDHPLATRGGLSEAEFGVYRTIAAKSDARTVLAFADGTPALVEGVAGKGRVVYSMLAIGSSLVPGKESPDAFFVRALGNLTGRDLPERDRKPPARTSDGWWTGLDGHSFGRFGWEVGSGLLVGQVGSRLKVRKDEAGYELTVPRTGDAPRKVTFAGDRAEPLSLGGEVAVDGEKAFRMDMSLAYPGVRWQVRRCEIELHLENLNAFAGLPSGRTIDLSKTALIDPAELTKPWLLLFNGSDRDSPLLLIFQRRPAKIETIRDDEAVGGLRLTASGESLGALVPTWIFGAKTVDTTKWGTVLPKEVQARSDEWCPYAFSYPIRVREEFRLDEAAKRIRIRSRFGYARTSDEWQTPRRQYAPLPPMAALLRGVSAASGETIVDVEPTVRPLDLVTTVGDFLAKVGTDRMEWSLPLFTPDLSLLPHVAGTSEFEAIANAHFAGGVRFTCGGGVKVDYRKDKGGYVRKRGEASCTLNMHGSTMGLCRCTPNPFIYSEENLRLMRRRMTWRLLEPLETMQYKMVCRWRQEPVSGVRYTIYMNSPRDISTVYDPPTYGSKIIYGDSNETVRMILTCVKVLEDRMGQQGLVKANWDALSRHVPSYEMAIDDWGLMASGCLEWGGPGSIDMLNSEFGCQMTLARLAEIAGDEAVRAQALYRAARRMCPTLARLRMRDYYARHGLLDRPEKYRASTGFNESGAVFQQRGQKVRDVDLFDMSQGIPQDLIALYRWYGWNELRRDYLSDVAKATPTTGLDYIATAILAIGSDLSPEALQDRLKTCAANQKLNSRLPRDWPGMDTGSYIEYALHRIYGSPVITDCRGVTLHSAIWDPEQKKLTLDVTPGENAVLTVDGRPVRLGEKGKRSRLVL